MPKLKKILVTGGAGYVGSVLCPKLLKKGYQVRVLDLLIYDPHSLDTCKQHPEFELIKGDIRNKTAVKKALKNIDCLIHLAAISNDPTCAIDENITKSVNYNAIKLLLEVAKKQNVQRFINASSSSVYGINEKKDVTEETPCHPLSLYGKYKFESEKLINQAGDKNFIVVNIRPATICGYSPHQRFDLTVNLLTCQALTKGVVTVHGGQQRRPNVTIQDITDLYLKLIDEEKTLIRGQTFNFGFENMKIIDIAKLIQKTLSPRKIEISIKPVFDERDYHISSKKIMQRLKIKPKYTVKNAVLELTNAFDKGFFSNPEDDKYYNIRKMRLEHFK